MSTDGKMSVPTKPAWHDLAEQATREGDGEKLCRLVEELCDTIDATRAATRKVPRSAVANEAQERSTK